MPPSSDDSVEARRLGGAEPSATAGHAPAAPSAETRELADCTARGRAVLRALVGGVPIGDALVVATDRNGFPLAQRVLPRPRDLPGAVVVGRHNRCALSIPNDNRVSLRHLLLVAWPGEGPLRFRGYDLGGRSGLVLADGQQVSGVSFQAQGLLRIGRTIVFVLPGGTVGTELFEGADDDVFRRLTGLDPTGRGVRLAMNATSEPGVAYLDPQPGREFGGYRGIDVELRPEPRGVLCLRSTKSSRRGEETRELGVDSRQLQRGLLIGRYSDRCSLAGHGRNLSRVHALVAQEGAESLLVYDLASTNGVRPGGATEGPSHAVVRLTPDAPVMLGHFELGWNPSRRIH